MGNLNGSHGAGPSRGLLWTADLDGRKPPLRHARDTLSSMQAAYSLIALLVTLTGIGCSARECRLDRECAGGQICLQSGTCHTLPMNPAPHVDRSDGFDDPPGTGRVFIVDTLGHLGPGQGFDLDGRCRGDGDCIDNALGLFGELMNDQIRQWLLGGETLLLVEVAGIDEPFAGDDENVTVKFYGAVDAETPLFPANNFQIPQGETKCCEFKIHADSIDSAGVQARSRIRARVEGGRLRSTEPATLRLPLLATTTSSASSFSLELRLARLSLTIGANFASLSEGIVAGTIPVYSLHSTPSLLCNSTNLLCPSGSRPGSWLEALLTLSQPDMDLDGDGLETFDTTLGGRVAVCRDGCLGCSRGPRVAPLDAQRPDSCVYAAAIADGYSAAQFFHAVPATVVGVALPPPPDPK